MKIRVESKAFSNAITWAAKNIAARPPQQAMSNLVIQTIGTTPFIGIATTDGESVSKACVSAEVDTVGAISVPGKLLAEIAGKLRSETVEITLEGGKAVLTCGRARYTLSIGELESHPQAPSPQGPSFETIPASHGEVAAAALNAAVAQVASAAGKDTAMPVLTGVQVTASNTALTLVATDRYRVAVREIPWTPTSAWSAENPWSATSELPEPILIPATKVVEATAGLMQVQSDKVALSLPIPSGPTVTLAGRGRVANTRTLEGAFPKWETILATCESQATATVTLSVKEFIVALNEVRVGKKSDAVRLTFSENTCLLEGEGLDVEGSSSADCEYDGEAITIAFNAEFLAAGLEAAGTPKVTVALSTPTKPALLRSTTPGYRYMLMPVRIERKV